MSKRTAAILIGALTFATASPIMGIWSVIPAVINAVFIHEFLTVEGY